MVGMTKKLPLPHPAPHPQAGTRLGEGKAATYRPLHQYDWSDRLQVLDELPDVHKRLIQDPRIEEMMARDMPVLAEVDGRCGGKT